MWGRTQLTFKQVDIYVAYASRRHKAVGCMSLELGKEIQGRNLEFVWAGDSI